LFQSSGIAKTTITKKKTVKKEKKREGNERHSGEGTSRSSERRRTEI